MLLITCGLAVAALTSGCKRPAGNLLGQAPQGEAIAIMDLRRNLKRAVPESEQRDLSSSQSSDIPPQVTLHGTMVEKCPVAGCWFRLRDDTGTIKVDTKSAGFVVVNVPLRSTVTVMGKPVREGNDLIVEAAGLRYWQ